MPEPYRQRRRRHKLEPEPARPRYFITEFITEARMGYRFILS